MKKITQLASLVGLFLFSYGVYADNIGDMPQKPFRHWGIGISAGTTGIGGNLITKASKNFVFRLGYDHLGYTYKPSDMTFDAEYEGQEVEAKVNILKVKFPNTKFLIDFYPLRNGSFSFTAGIYMGDNKFKMDGYAPQKFELDDIIIVYNN